MARVWAKTRSWMDVGANFFFYVGSAIANPTRQIKGEKSMPWPLGGGSQGGVRHRWRSADRGGFPN